MTFINTDFVFVLVSRAEFHDARGIKVWVDRGREGCVIDSIPIPSNITPNHEAQCNWKSLHVASAGDAAAIGASPLSTFSRCSLSCKASK
jgi:hypothetical protein